MAGSAVKAGLGVLLVAIVFAAYLPATHGGSFVWDDFDYIVNLKAVNRPAGLRRIWADPDATPQYYPVTFTSFWIERQVWGARPAAYRQANIVLHAINVLLLWAVLRRLGGCPLFASAKRGRSPPPGSGRGTVPFSREELGKGGSPLAWWVAAIFAVHPLNVESVAWITERKNVLSGFFALLSLIAYLRFAGLAGRRAPFRVAAEQQGSDRSRARPKSEIRNPKSFFSAFARPRVRASAFYVFSLLLFVLALLSKTMVCTLPGVILLLIWKGLSPFPSSISEKGTVPLSEGDRADRPRFAHDPKRGQSALWPTIVALAPFFLLAVGSGLLTMWIEYRHMWMGPVGATEPPSLPDRLIVMGRSLWFYAGKVLWPTNLAAVYPKWPVDGSAAWQYGFAAAGVGALGALWAMRKHWGRGAPAAALMFVGMLFPVSGVFFFAYLMDYSFVADHFVYLSAVPLLALAVAAMGGLLRTADCGSRIEEPHAKALSSANPKSKIRNPKSGGRKGVARVTAVATGMAVLLALGSITWRQAGLYKDAMKLWVDTVARNPNCANAQSNLGYELIKAAEIAESQGRSAERFKLLAEAAVALDESIALNPGHPYSRYDRGLVYYYLNDLDNAIREYTKAIDLDPKLFQASNNRAAAHLLKGDFVRGLADAQRAVQIEPESATAHYLRGTAYRGLGQLAAAISDLTQAIRLDPTNPGYYAARADAFSQMGQYGNALADAEACQRLGGKPTDPDYMSKMRQAAEQEK